MNSTQIKELLDAVIGNQQLSSIADNALPEGLNAIATLALAYNVAELNEQLSNITTSRGTLVVEVRP